MYTIPARDTVAGDATERSRTSNNRLIVDDISMRSEFVGAVFFAARDVAAEAGAGVYGDEACGHCRSGVPCDDWIDPWSFVYADGGDACRERKSQEVNEGGGGET